MDRKTTNIYVSFTLAVILTFVIDTFAYGAPSQFMRRFSVVRNAATQEKVVALTYDDGPNPIYTPEILKILEKHRVKATFFLIGSMMDKYPEITKDISDKGHLIANHTYSHPRDLRLMKRDAVVEDIRKCSSTVEKITGKRPYIFRSPRGVVDSTVMDIVDELDMKMVLWSVCADHHDAPTPDLMMQRVMRLIKPGGIILMHDGTFYTRWKDVLATDLIITSLKKRGYRFVTLLELLRIRENSLKHKLLKLNGGL